MTQKDNTSRPVTRRRVLGATAGVLGLGALGPESIDVVSARDSDAYRGRELFVELFVEHDGITKTDREVVGVDVGCGEPKYVTHDSGLYVAHGSPASFEGGSIVSTGMKQHSLPATVHGGRTDTVPLDVSEPHFITHHLRVEDEYDAPEVRVDTNGDAAEVFIDGAGRTVGAGDATEFVLDDRSVDVRFRGEYEKIPNQRNVGEETVSTRKSDPVGSVELTPKVTVLNHGSIDVYGVEGGIVLPADTSIPLARRALRHGNYDTNQIQSQDLIVVRTEDRQ